MVAYTGGEVKNVILTRYVILNGITELILLYHTIQKGARYNETNKL